MATHTIEPMPTHSVGVTQQDQHVGNHDVAHASAAMPTTVTPPRRRSEARTGYRCLCSYEVLEAIDDEPVVIEQGQALALNRSTDGILLFMSLAPHAKQPIQVHTPLSGWDQTANVFETRWVRPVPVESHGNLYLVGCRRILGLGHYLSVSSNRSGHQGAHKDTSDKRQEGAITRVNGGGD